MIKLLMTFNEVTTFRTKTWRFSFLLTESEVKLFIATFSSDRLLRHFSDFDSVKLSQLRRQQLQKKRLRSSLNPASRILNMMPEEGKDLNQGDISIQDQGKNFSLPSFVADKETEKVPAPEISAKKKKKASLVPGDRLGQLMSDLEDSKDQMKDSVCSCKPLPSLEDKK